MRYGRRRGLTAVVTASVAALLLAPGGVAHADGAETTATAAASSSASGGQEVVIAVTYSYSEGGSYGGGPVTSSTTAVATVDPVCSLVPGNTGKKQHEWLNSRDVSITAAGEGAGASDWKADYPDLDKHKDDDEGRWYSPSCHWSSSSALSFEEYQEISAEFQANNGPVFVPAGAQPPAPLIDGRTLAGAAWDAVTIPEPQVEYNPRLGESGRTLVGFDTWVWATQTPVEGTATATAGPVTATVTATSAGLDLSGPDMEVSCQGFGTPWTQGADSTDCMVVFTRSSAHLGGSTPVRVAVSYQTTFTASDGVSGSLDGVTTSATVSIPVAEVQVLNRSDKPTKN